MPLPKRSGQCGVGGRESQLWALPLGSVTLGKKNLSVSESLFLTSSRKIIIPSYLIGFKKKKNPHDLVVKIK